MAVTWELADAAIGTRKQLRLAGFTPIPTQGKAAVMQGWQNTTTVTEAEIESWFHTFPDALNTGIITRLTPCVDIDVLDPEIAAEIEQALWNLIGSRAPVRFGLAPKRAILFRTEVPFAKISTPVFTSPNLQKHKVEILCTGQQVICFGEHPGTKQPYAWFGGEPGNGVTRADLPELPEAAARKFAATAADIMRAHGLTEPAKTNGANGNGADHVAGHGDFSFDLLYGDRERKYAAMALQGMHDEISAMPPDSGRNSRLNALSFRAGTLVARGWIDRDTVAGRLLDAAAACRLVADDGEAACKATIRSGLLKGALTPAADLPDNGTGTPGAAAAPATPATSFPFEYAADFSEDTAPNWIIKNVIAFGAVTSWIGPPGSGKSLMLGDIAIHLVSGIDWRGYKIKAKVGVLYFALERADLVKRRFRVQAKKLALALDTLPFAVCREVINLMHPGCSDQIVATIKAVEAGWTGTKVGLIVLDTMSKAVAAGGGDENSARDTNIAHANLRRVLAQIEVHVALIGHVGKDASRGQRGSNASLADVDAEHTFGDGEVTRTKNNDGPIGRMFGFRIATVPLGVDDDGDEISIAIVADDDPGGVHRPASRRAKLNRGQRRAMDLLDRALIEEGEPPNLPEIPYSVTRVVTKEIWCRYCVDGALSSGDANSSKKAFRRAMQDLVELSFVGVWRDFVWCAYD